MAYQYQDTIYDPNRYNVTFNPTGRQQGTFGLSYNPGTGSSNYQSADQDVRDAQTYLDQYNDKSRSSGKGITYKETGIRQAYEQAASRVAQKKALAEAMANDFANIEEEKSLLKRETQDAVTKGVGETRKNYNRRGLLYSGLREGGETNIRSQGAQALSSGLSAAQKEYENTTDARKAAFAAVGMQNAQEQLQNSNIAFENSMKNSIARRQAVQQLGQGAGYLAGSVYGSQPSQTQSTSTQGTGLIYDPYESSRYSGVLGNYNLAG